MALRAAPIARTHPRHAPVRAGAVQHRQGQPVRQRRRERTNVTGSATRCRLIKEGITEALQVALEQVENGAQVIDVNMDEGLLDAEKECDPFPQSAASEPDIARVPVMVDSSKREVIEAGLKCIQGKGIVKSDFNEGKGEENSSSRPNWCAVTGGGDCDGLR